jgi:cysteine synthase B
MSTALQHTALIEPVSLVTERQRMLDRLERTAVVQQIGNTPLVRVGALADAAGLPPEVELWLKLEWANPGGSVKDRPALAIVRDAIASGALRAGKTLLDATSGNTGIAYAMLGAALGFPVELVVPGSASGERKAILAAYGAQVILSDPYEGSNGAIRHARERYLAAPDRYVLADQYNNPANPAAHTATTGPKSGGKPSGGSPTSSPGSARPARSWGQGAT